MVRVSTHLYFNKIAHMAHQYEPIDSLEAESSKGEKLITGLLETGAEPQLAPVAVTGPSSRKDLPTEAGLPPSPRLCSPSVSSVI